jgi:hypothetical protein
MTAALRPSFLPIRGTRTRGRSSTRGMRWGDRSRSWPRPDGRFGPPGADPARDRDAQPGVSLVGPWKTSD